MTSTAGSQAVVKRLEAMPLRVRLVAIVLVVLAAALLCRTSPTAYLMQRDLLGRVDTELKRCRQTRCDTGVDGPHQG